MNDGNVYASSSLSVDEVVRKTYESVQRTRNRIRRQLLRNELKESWNGVHGQQSEETKQQPHDDDVRANNSNEDGGEDTTRWRAKEADWPSSLIIGSL